MLRTRPKSEVVAFGKLMAILAMMRAKDPLISFGVEVYEDATVDVSIQTLTKTVMLLRDAGGWRPDPGELLQACERTRLERRNVPFTPCENCSKDGWTEREIDGVRRMVRCSCWAAHQERLAALGAGNVPLALPAGREEGE